LLYQLSYALEVSDSRGFAKVRENQRCRRAKERNPLDFGRVSVVFDFTLHGRVCWDRF